MFFGLKLALFAGGYQERYVLTRLSRTLCPDQVIKNVLSGPGYQENYVRIGLSRTLRPHQAIKNVMSGSGYEEHYDRTRLSRTLCPDQVIKIHARRQEASTSFAAALPLESGLFPLEHFLPVAIHDSNFACRKGLPARQGFH
ncbi:hypothetical protein PoB_000596400 [Plakobranchus ocellatus]|uniref:Uncharacterized protein n=1 Tax=Plakobranchus ocellatus TaxID=259542 RepID=A0AAV3YAZ7_9GAST|nr:hypothetical protein PoB_000596400 [Plakobranchus ocellatus]